MAFRPDSKMLAYATKTGRLTLLDLATGKMAHDYTVKGGGVRSMIFSPDGKDIVAEIGGPGGYYLARLTAATGQAQWRLDVDRASDLAFIADAKAMTVTEDGNITRAGYHFTTNDGISYTFLSLILQNGGSYLSDDGTFTFQTPEAAASLETLIGAPSGSRLWFDTRDIPFFRQDEKDEAEVRSKDAVTIRQLIDAGYTADSVIAALAAADWSLLEHSGLFSVQLQPPGQSQPTPSTAA